MSKQARELARALAEVSYRELSQRMNEDALDHIWDAHSRAAFIALLHDGAAEPRAVFLAAEIAARRDQTVFEEADKAVLARAYVTALRENFTGSANPWGLPKRGARLVFA